MASLKNCSKGLKCSVARRLFNKVDSWTVGLNSGIASKCSSSWSAGPFWCWTIGIVQCTICSANAIPKIRAAALFFEICTAFIEGSGNLSPLLSKRSSPCRQIIKDLPEEAQVNKAFLIRFRPLTDKKLPRRPSSATTQFFRDVTQEDSSVHPISSGAARPSRASVAGWYVTLECLRYNDELITSKKPHCDSCAAAISRLLIASFILALCTTNELASNPALGKHTTDLTSSRNPLQQRSILCSISRIQRTIANFYLTY